LLIAVLAGVAAGVALVGLMEISVRYIPEASLWDSLMGIANRSLTPLIPGVVAGFVAARAGFVVGATASVATSVLYRPYVGITETRSIMERGPEAAIPESLAYAIVALFVGGVCGVAGAAVARGGRNAF
jgi:hypothetical protein